MKRFSDSMFLTAVLLIELHLPAAQSLKQKRSVIKSLKDRVRAKFNVSIAEVDHLDKWQLATLAISVVSNDRIHLESQLSRVSEYIESETLGSAVILKQEVSLL